MNDPGELLQDFRATQHPDALARLVDRYRPMVQAACGRYLGRPGSEDATQQVFFALRYDHEVIRGSVAGWLYSCAINTSKSTLRAQPLAGRKEEPCPSGLETRERQEFRRVVDDCLEELVLAERDLIVEYLIVGRTQEDLAEGLGVSVQTVQKRLMTALDHLRGRLRRRGEKHSLTALIAVLRMPWAAAMPVAAGAQRGRFLKLLAAVLGVVLTGVVGFLAWDAPSLFP